MDRWERQRGLLTHEIETVVIIGVGGLGSHLAQRMRLGVGRILLFDPDVVEQVNLGPQAFDNDDVGKSKVEACRDRLAAMTLAQVETYPVCYVGQPIPKGAVVVCVVDNLETRKMIWREWIRFNAGISLWIDGRMGGLWGRIYALDPMDVPQVDWYDQKLAKAGQPEELPCTERGIDYNCAGLSCYMAAIIGAWRQGNRIPKDLTVDFCNFALEPIW